jgi:hypothetical protein
MKIQEVLSEVPAPYSEFHVTNRVPDSYSRMLDHQVGEWEQPYGYDIRPLEPMEYERMEHSEPKKGKK